MKIDDTPRPIRPPRADTERDGPPESESAPPRSAPTGDVLGLSPAAREIHAARQQLKAIPDVDAERVAELQSKVASGDYRTEAVCLAERLLREHFLKDL